VTDVININSVSSFLDSTTIIGPASRPCSVNVANGNLGFIAGSLTVTMGRGGLDTINVNDQSATADKVYSVMTNQLAVQGGGPNINYSGAERLNIQAGSGSDFIALDTVPAGMTVNAHGNGGNETLRLGAADLPVNVLAPVTVSGDSGTDLLIVNSLFGLQFQNSELTNSTFANVLTHSYNTVENVRIIQTQGGSTLNIKSANVPTTVLSGNGNDAITIGNGDYDLNIPAPVSISAAGGNDSILINDASDDAGNDQYTCANTYFRKTQPSLQLSFSSVEQFSLNASPQNDTINISRPRGRSRWMQARAMTRSTSATARSKPSQHPARSIAVPGRIRLGSAMM
jgi:hypothetical protein